MTDHHYVSSFELPHYKARGLGGGGDSPTILALDGPPNIILKAPQETWYSCH